jgi:hypothetical protein
MKHYIFADKIEIEPVNKLLDFINSNDDQITILVECSGGYNYLFDYLIYFLNLNQERIILMAGSQISSNGFNIFYQFKGKRIVGDDTFALVHKSFFDIDTSNLNDTGSIQFKKLQVLNKLNSEYFEILKPNLTKTEQVKFKKGFSIALEPSRIREICKI